VADRALLLAVAGLLLAGGCSGSGTIPGDDDDTAIPDDDMSDDDDADDDASDDDSAAGDDDAGDDDTGEPHCSGGSGIDPGYQFMTVAGESCWLFVPQSLQACAPLFLFGHGGNTPGGSLQDGMWNDLPNTGLPVFAEQHGFVLLVPFVEDVQHTNHGWSLQDVATMESMIDTVAAGVDIDHDHLLFAGTSAGGVMAAYWGLWEPGYLSHVGVLASGYGYQVEYPPQDPDPKHPFFVGHDPDDEIAPYSLSVEFTEDLLAHGHDVLFVDTDVGGNGHGWAPPVTEQILQWWLP